MGNKKYLAELRDKRASCLAAQSNLINSNGGFTDRAEFSRLTEKINDLDAQIVQAKQRFEGAPGKRKNGVEGRQMEVLSADQSISSWLKGARENNVSLTTESGRPYSLRSEGSDMDFNSYWADAMGMRRNPGPEFRAMGEEVGSGGSAIVPTQWQAKFVDYLYPLTVMGNAGMSKFVMPAQTVLLPQLTSPQAPQWIAENNTVNLDASASLADITFAAHGAFVDLFTYSYEMAQDSLISGGLDQVIQDSMAARYKIIVDQAALYGIAGYPVGNPGMVNEGITLHKWDAHGGTAGTAPTNPNELSVMAEMVRNANAEPNHFLGSPAAFGTLSRLAGSGGTYPLYWKPSPDVIDIWPPVYSTTLGGNTETDPAAGNIPALTGGSYQSMYCGDFTRVIFGARLDMTVVPLRELFAQSKQYGIMTYMRYSIRTSHPEAFVRSTGLIVA